MATNNNSNQNKNTSADANQNPNQNVNAESLPYRTFNTTLYQGLNPSDFYSQNGSDGCAMQGCVPNVVNQERFGLPSIAEIAAFNRQMLNTPNVIPSPAPPQSGTVRPQQTPAPETNMPQGVPETPATVLNYGATIDTSEVPNTGITGITDVNNPFPVTPESLQYLNGFLRTQIGRRVSIDFLVGSNTIITKLGFLLGVATNYILINELDTNDITTCDFYNIKFIRFYY